MERKYSIYRITSPSGKIYIGLTSRAVSERWRSHVTFSKRIHPSKTYLINRPFYNALRKYPKDQFIIETLGVGLTLKEAQRKEIYHIWLTPPSKRYNLSAGGENDSAEGGKQFWAYIRKHPDELTSYLEKLKAGCLKRNPEQYKHLAEKNLEWRKTHKKEVYKNARRASRFSRKNVIKKEKPEISRKRKLEYRFKRGNIVAENWKKYPIEKKKAISKKISETLIKRNKKLTTEELRIMTSKARSCINRKKQGSAASKGQKAWWAALKKDPVRYKEYMTTRTKSLLKTLSKK